MSEKTISEDKAKACRQSAKDILQERIGALRRKADELEALLNCLPEIDGQAESALYKLIHSGLYDRH